MQPMYHMGSFIGEGVPVWDIRTAGGTDMLVRNNQLGRSLAQTLGNKSAALMRGHGPRWWPRRCTLSWGRPTTSI